MKLGEFRNLSDDIDIFGTVDNLQVSVGDALLGRVIDAMECPADGCGEIETKLKYPLFENPQKPMERKPISELLYTGIRSIDSSLAIGKGQGLGIFGGSGVGKTSLLSMIAKNNNADINVIGLIGDRSRENQDFINNLGQECLRHSVIVEANSEQLAISNVRSAYVCSAISGYFRDNGNKRERLEKYEDLLCAYKNLLEVKKILEFKI
ncbi:ATP-binding cassette domain-containing protein [Treponema sp.]|uniref:ATP-binding cassette domain-containing protein n=1 Tax=Treponema sp. TaxID=166 RepID=UPI00298E48E5|nr:ATP-binding cassette domain-containing protein [Treponema sp.]MCQ2240895.1 hypothetical protein [Treponema sp.]